MRAIARLLAHSCLIAAALVAGPALAGAVQLAAGPSVQLIPIALQAAATKDQQPVAAKPVHIDDGALRYYAQHGQTDRVRIELHRLQTLYPGYTQPEDLFEPVADAGGPDDQPLWDLFGAGKLDEVYTQINARKLLEPGWEPPKLLLEKLHQRGERTKVMTLFGSRKWGQLLALAKDDASLIDTTDLELMWTLAESYAHAHQPEEALAVYASILKSNKAPEKRLATLQKSMSNLHMSAVETLYAMGKKSAGGVNEFDVIKTDLTRARITAFLHDEREDNIDPLDIEAFSTFAKAVADPNQAGLIGWYHYKRNEFDQSLDWFKWAISHGGDAKIAHGLAHSLRQLGKFREAEEVAYVWRRYDVANSMLFIDLLVPDLSRPVPPYIDNQRLARYAVESLETASGDGAQALGWYAYNSCQYHAALEWFERAMAWAPHEQAATGLALTFRRLGDRAHFIDTLNRYDGLFPKVIDLVFPINHYTSPTPCEQSVIAPQDFAQVLPIQPAPDPANPNPTAAAPNAGSNALREPTIAYPQGMAPDYPGSVHDPLRRFTWGYVPSPSGAPFIPVQASYHGEQWHPFPFDPDVLPQMVDPQNPWRFVASGQPNANPVPASVFAPAPASAEAREPFATQWPLLTRKVAGAPPMPYETNGYHLHEVQIPDPKHKGAFLQALRFIPPQQIGSPYAQQPFPAVQGMMPAFAPPPQPISYNLPTSTLAPAAPAQQPYVAPTASVPDQVVVPHRAAPRVSRKKAPAARHVFARVMGSDCGGGDAGPSGALAKGWCYLNLHRPQEAALAFDQAMVGIGTTRSDAAYGKALASLQSNLVEPAAQVASSGALTPQHRHDIAIAVLVTNANEAYKRRQFAQVLSLLDQRRALAPETRDLSVLRAWSFYGLGRWDEARRLFAALDQQMSTPDTQRGLGQVTSQLSGNH